MMEVDPVLKLDVQIDPINSHLCLFCQLKSNEPLVVCPKQVDRIIKCLESLECLEIGHYEDINKRIGRTEARIRNKMSYHISCYKSFTTIERMYIDTNADRCSMEKSNLNAQSAGRLSRASISPFDPTKCVFCQDDSKEPLHALGTDKKIVETRDAEFKRALRECPESLAIVRIRSERAFDSRAGDLMYHQRCWNAKIKRRVPDYEVPVDLHENKQVNSRYGDGGGGGAGYTPAYLSLCAVAEELHSVGTDIILDPCGRYRLQ